MESEHRELGLGDPTLGKTVRKLVGSLARGSSCGAATVDGEAGWDEATRDSLYQDAVSADALSHSSERRCAASGRSLERSRSRRSSVEGKIE